MPLDPTTDRPINTPAGPPPVGRLAPSPTGALHLGNARSFLAAWLAARLSGARLLLRIEDLDGPRIKPWALNQAREDLEYLGLDWDAEQPKQTERESAYATTIAALTARKLLYPCICSRKDALAAASAPHAGDLGPAYPGTCRDRFPDIAAATAQLRSEAPTGSGGAERMPVLRLRLPEALAPVSFYDQFAGPQQVDLVRAMGDFVVAKSPTLPAYQLAVVLDDAAGAVTQVIRGDDLLPSAALQIHLQQLLGLPTPDYWHLPLVVGPDGRRLAKRHGDTRLSWFRERGVGGPQVVGFLAHRSGWIDRPAALSAAELLQHLQAVARAPGYAEKNPLTALFAPMPKTPLVLSADAIAQELGVRP